MFISGDWIGASFFLDGIPVFENKAYNKVELFGGDSTYAISDRFWIKNNIDTSYFEAVEKVSDYNPTFSGDTIFLTNFINNLDGGNISGSGEPLIAWLYLKRNINESINHTIGLFPPETSSYRDFRVQKGQTYIYTAFPVTETKVGQPVISENVTSDYYGMYFIDEDNGLVLNFDANGIIGQTNSNDDINIYNTQNQFDTISKGDKNYLSGTVSGVVSSNPNICEEIVQPSEFITLVQDFVASSSKNKLLKTRKGDIYKIETSGFSKVPLDERIPEQVERVSFNWIQTERLTDF